MFSGGVRGNDTRSKPAVKAVSEVELSTTARMSGSALVRWTMCASCVHMLCGVSGAGGGGGDMLIVEGVDGGSAVSAIPAMQHAPVELEEKHAGGRLRCGVQRGHRGGSKGGVAGGARSETEMSQDAARILLFYQHDARPL